MKKIFALLICLCLFAGVLTACAPADTGTTPDSSAAAGGGTAAPSDKEARKAALKAEFLKAANEVTVDDDSVTFSDASSAEGKITVKKNPANVGYSWGIIRVGSLLPTRFSFPHAILMRFNPNRIVAN